MSHEKRSVYSLLAKQWCRVQCLVGQRSCYCVTSNSKGGNSKACSLSCLMSLKNSEHLLLATRICLSNSSLAPAACTYANKQNPSQCQTTKQTRKLCTGHTKCLNVASHVREGVAQQGHETFADTVQLAFTRDPGNPCPWIFLHLEFMSH